MVKGYNEFLNKKRIRDSLRLKIVNQTECDSYVHLQNINHLNKTIWFSYAILILISLVVFLIFSSIDKNNFKIALLAATLVDVIIGLILAVILYYTKEDAKEQYKRDLEARISKSDELKKQTLDLSKISLLSYSLNLSSNYLNNFEKESRSQILGEISSFYAHLIDQYKNLGNTDEDYIEFYENWVKAKK